MEIKDKNGKLLAMVVDYISHEESKFFVTDNEAELQVKTNRLNIGLVQLFDGENFSVINDTLMFASDSIIIYDQDPKFGKKVKIGDYVDLYFTFYSLENDTTFNSYLDKND